MVTRPRGLTLDVSHRRVRLLDVSAVPSPRGIRNLEGAGFSKTLGQLVELLLPPLFLRAQLCSPPLGDRQPAPTNKGAPPGPADIIKHPRTPQGKRAEDKKTAG